MKSGAWVRKHQVNKSLQTSLKGRAAGWTKIIKYVNLQPGNENFGQNQWLMGAPALGFHLSSLGSPLR